MTASGDACRLVWDWAEDGISVSDVRMRARLVPPSMSVGVDEVMRAVDSGVDAGMLTRSGDWLKRSTADVWSGAWLTDLLWRADTSAWSWWESDRGPAGRKVDDRARRELGLAGELAFLDAARNVLPPHTHSAIVHVAAEDDTAGFDVVCPSTALFTRPVHVEVKATVRAAGRVAFFLTRNETRVGKRDPAWRLMVMRRAGEVWLPVGHVPFAQLAAHLPEDRGAGRWESCHVVLLDSDLVPGLP